MWFVWESFLRLEHFVRTCSTYQRRWDTVLAVLGSYLALFTYTFVAVLSRFYRRRVVLAFVAGFGVSGGAVWAASAWTPEVTNTHAPCAVEVSGRAAEEATIVLYTVGFVLFHEWAFPPRTWDRRHCWWVWVRLAVCVLYAFAGVYSPYALGLQPSISLATGAAVGLATAGATVWCLVRLPEPHDPRLGPLRALLCLPDPSATVAAEPAGRKDGPLPS